MKTCKVCGESKLFHQFRLNPGSAEKRRKTCYECELAAGRTRRAKKAEPDFDIDVIEPPAITAPMPHPVPQCRSFVFPHGRETLAPPPGELSHVLFIPDVHRPYHDKKAWALMLRAAREFKPDKIVVLGDFADFYSVSSFDKHPRRVSDLKTEAEDANIGLDELDALDATCKVFIKGNHEDRLERYLCKSAPALFGCVSVNDLFHLGERGWQVVEYKRSTRLGKLRLTHDTGTAGINAHRQSVDAFQAPVIIGHTHRMEMSFRGCADGSPTVGAMFGWLGDFDSIDYMQAVKARRDWVHGFGVGFQEGNGVIHLNPVPIIDGRCVIAGKLIT